MGFPPPLPSCRPCARITRCCLGVAPPPPLGQTPLPLLKGVRKECALLLGGCPPHLLSPCYTLVDHTAWLRCPPLSPGCTRKRALLCGGSPHLLHILAIRWGSACISPGVPFHYLATCKKCVLLGGGAPPPPFVTTCIQRALPIGGSLPLGLVLWLAICKECALPVPFPLPRLLHVCTPCL